MLTRAFRCAHTHTNANPRGLLCAVRSEGDLLTEQTWRRRCPRQLQCMQSLLRAALLERRHFDGGRIPLGVYTDSDAEWANYSRGACDPAVLALPPQRCNEGVVPERSVLTCGELQAPASSPSSSSSSSSSL
eukprot:6213038-Pleurochrysis_carterae.AAC.3